MMTIVVKLTCTSQRWSTVGDKKFKNIYIKLNTIFVFIFFLEIKF